MDYYKLKDEEYTKPVVNQPMAVANNIGIFYILIIYTTKKLTCFYLITAVEVNNKKIRREWSIDLCDVSRLKK
jgi:hypothetical protein